MLQRMHVVHIPGCMLDPDICKLSVQIVMCLAAARSIFWLLHSYFRFACVIDHCFLLSSGIM